MKLYEILEFLKIRKGELFRNCFTVDIIGSDILSFICIFYKGEWIVVSKATERIIYWCNSRLDCLYMLNYLYGLPF